MLELCKIISRFLVRGVPKSSFKFIFCEDFFEKINAICFLYHRNLKIMLISTLWYFDTHATQKFKIIIF